MTATLLSTDYMARKKPVEQKYQPNSYRVISQEAEQWQRPERSMTFNAKLESNVLGQSEKFVPIIQHRKNRPNPNHVGFLSQDVRLLNEPVCDVYTDCSHAEQWDWWPSRTSNEPLKQPEHTLDTTVRDDFQYRGSDVQGSTRHTANPNKKPAHGIAPVNLMRERDGKQRVYKEGISYEHQYNSRLDPQYPIRGKRHGAFVWDKFSQDDVDRMLHHFGVVTDEQQQLKISKQSSKVNTPDTGSPKHTSKPPSPKITPAPKSATVISNSKPASPKAKNVTPKSAHPVIAAAKTLPSEPSVIEVTTGKPLSRCRTESILSAASQQRGSSERLRLPPIAL